MSVTGAVVWLIAMAIAVTTVLVVGTLTAADLMPRRRRPDAENADRSPAGKVAAEPHQQRAA